MPATRLHNWLRQPTIWLTGISLVWVVLSSYSLMTYPGPYIDEAWLGSIAYNYSETGQYSVPVFPSFYVTSQNYVKESYLYIAGVALVFRVFGVGLQQMRIFSMVGAWLGGALLFRLGRRLYSPTTGLIAMAVYLLSLRLLWSSHVGRPETWSNVFALFICLAFFYVKETRSSWYAFFLLGMLSALILALRITLVHATVAISLFVLIELRQRKDWGKLSWYILGGMIGVGWVLAILLAPNPGDALEKIGWARQQTSAHLGAITTIGEFLSRILAFLWNRFVTYSRIGPLESIYITLGVIGFGIRRQYPDYFALASLAIAMAGHMFLYSGGYHAASIMPLASLGVATACVSAATWLIGRYKSWQRLPLPGAATILVAPLLAGYLAGIILMGWQNRVVAYERYVSALQALVPPGASLFGDISWWWGFYDYPYQADIFVLIEGSDPEQMTWAILSSAAVDIILLDEEVGSINSDGSEAYKAVLDNYVQTNCTLIGSVDDYVISSYFGGPAKKHTFVYQCPVLTPADVAQQ